MELNDINEELRASGAGAHSLRKPWNLPLITDPHSQVAMQVCG